MPRILHIAASPKGGHSTSRRLADLFLATYSERNPGDEIVTHSVFDMDLPDFAHDEVTAKFSSLFEEEVTAEQKAKWDRILGYVKDFDSFDKFLVSCPMWNGGVPYRMKHYIDLIMQPFITFGYNFETKEHFGLLRDRPAQLILTRSSVDVGSSEDFQLDFMKHFFAFQGIKDIRSVVVPKTTQPSREEREAYVASFEGAVRQAAQAF